MRTLPNGRYPFESVPTDVLSLPVVPLDGPLSPSQQISLPDSRGSFSSGIAVQHKTLESIGST
jgi:hypothetical protein